MFYFCSWVGHSDNGNVLLQLDLQSKDFRAFNLYLKGYSPAKAIFFLYLKIVLLLLLLLLVGTEAKLSPTFPWPLSRRTFRNATLRSLSVTVIILFSFYKV